MSLDLIRIHITHEIGEGYRLAHILGVEQECIRLASLFSLSPEQAYELRVAALLHDLTKNRKPAEQRALYQQLGISFGELEEHSPKTLHAVTGAHLARQIFPDEVNDAVFRCILRHTTGAPDMTLLEKLLYLADYIEPGRTFPSCVALRNAFWALPSEIPLNTHLNRILIRSFDQTLTELVEEHAYIHPTTTEARNYLLVHP